MSLREDNQTTTPHTNADNTASPGDETAPGMAAPAAPQRPLSSRLSSTYGWVLGHRRETGAGVVLLMMTLMLWEPAPAVQPATPVEEYQFESIDALFADLDAVQARSRHTGSDNAGPAADTADTADANTNPHHNASWPGDHSPSAPAPHSEQGPPPTSPPTSPAADFDGAPRADYGDPATGSHAADGSVPPIRFSGVINLQD